MKTSALKSVVMEASGVEIEEETLREFSALLSTIAAGLADPSLVIPRKVQPAFMQFGR